MDVKTLKKKTIVFVEDDPVVVMAYRNLLERGGGFCIEPARDGLEAMKLLSSLVPDLVILDLMLPRFSGVDVLKFAQSNTRLKGVPIIILSTNSITDPTEEYILERAHKRLLKDSCTPAILLQTVQELLGHPLAPSNVSSAQPSHGVKTTKSRTIVYVEDNPVVLLAYRNRLERDGFQVEPVADGLEAMKLLSRQVPDAVILDLVLPKFNGVDVLKFIRSNPRLNAVSVIILSTNSIIDTADEYVLERANKRLLKGSCTPAIMAQTIHELLGDPSAASAVPSGNSDALESKAEKLAADANVVT
ncbi:MAG TPA: response regulator [Candidatus Sulfopaludibacter sp.]|nr:response regulator [Candidatus Sulfopaludibacter sp.]